MCCGQPVSLGSFWAGQALEHGDFDSDGGGDEELEACQKLDESSVGCDGEERPMSAAPAVVHAAWPRTLAMPEVSAAPCSASLEDWAKTASAVRAMVALQRARRLVERWRRYA